VVFVDLTYHVHRSVDIEGGQYHKNTEFECKVEDNLERHCSEPYKAEDNLERHFSEPYKAGEVRTQPKAQEEHTSVEDKNFEVRERRSAKIKQERIEHRLVLQRISYEFVGARVRVPVVRVRVVH